MTEQELADQAVATQVAQRLEGKKRFLVQARETVYYEVEVWATDRDDAWDESGEVEDWGDPVDGCDFEVCHIEEVKQ